MIANHAGWMADSVAVTALLVLGWQMIANYSGIPQVFLPGPDRAWGALVNEFTNGDLARLSLATIERMIYGWVLASIAGIILGATIGTSIIARDMWRRCWRWCGRCRCPLSCRW